MKIAFFWTWDFSKNILKSILEHHKQVEVRVVVSQPDKPVWRKQILSPTPIKIFANKYQITCLQPEKIKENTELIHTLETENLDFIVVVAYGKIIPQNILDIPKYASINIHGSILPFYRWASPVQESIKNGETRTWLTIMYMNDNMDEGDILNIQEIDIDPNDTTTDIFEKFALFWPSLLVHTLEWIIEWRIISKKQDHTQATYCKKITKEEWKIDFQNEDGPTIYNKYRAYFVWPWVYSFYNKKKIQFTQITFEANDDCFWDWFSLWDVVEYETEGKLHIAILVKWWLLVLHKVKLEGKKEMDILSFVNGNRDFLEYNFL